MKIALVSKKGGVAKTSTAVSLAAALANRGRKVLVIDLDPQASSSLWLGVDRADLAPSIADVLYGSSSTRDAIRASRVEGLSLITSSADLAAADRELGAFKDREQILTRKLEGVADEFDYVFFDCPPSLTLLPSLALVAADAFLLPVTPQYLASEGLDNMMLAIDRLAFRNGRRCRCLGLLLTLVDYRTRLSREKVPELRAEFGNKVFAVEVRTNVRLAEAPAYGLTIFEYDKRSTAAKAYKLLADELELRCETLLAARSRLESVEKSSTFPVSSGAVPAGDRVDVYGSAEPATPAQHNSRAATAAATSAEPHPESEQEEPERRAPRRDRPTWIPGLPKTVVGLN